MSQIHGREICMINTATRIGKGRRNVFRVRLNKLSAFLMSRTRTQHHSPHTYALYNRTLKLELHIFVSDSKWTAILYANV